MYRRTHFVLYDCDCQDTKQSLIFVLLASETNQKIFLFEFWAWIDCLEETETGIVTVCFILIFVFFKFYGGFFFWFIVGNWNVS